MSCKIERQSFAGSWLSSSKWGDQCLLGKQLSFFSLFTFTGWAIIIFQNNYEGISAYWVSNYTKGFSYFTFTRWAIIFFQNTYEGISAYWVSNYNNLFFSSYFTFYFCWVSNYNLSKHLWGDQCLLGEQL